MVRPEIFENDIGNLFNLHYKSIESRMVGGGGAVQSHQKPDDPD